MHIHARAPLRLGLAGGGTDVSPYADLYGGYILNATVNLYARVGILPRCDGTIVLRSLDQGVREEFDLTDTLPPGGKLGLLKGVYNRIMRDFPRDLRGFECTTHVDAPPGSGLGSSSTLVTALVGAFAEWLELPLGEYDIAHLAYQIERQDLEMAGGRQDQYAATFGGFNFMEFYADDKVIVNPLRIKESYIYDLENSFLLYYTGTSRLSSTIIKEQSKNISTNNERSIEAMHRLKEQAVQMKEALLMGRLADLGEILNFGWNSKKKMAEGISNPQIECIYNAAISAGAAGGKISGAGGGGHMMFYCPDNKWFDVAQALKPFKGTVIRVQFEPRGLISWESK